MSMAHSLELRVPLLDTWLVNEVMAWPTASRLSGPRKATLREAMREKLPAEILDRRTKRGFTFPMQRWLAAPSANDLWDGLTDIKRDFDAGRVHWSRVWALMVLKQWQIQ